MNVLLNGDLIQVAAVWTVVVALLTKFTDFNIYIYIYIYTHTHTHTHTQSYGNSSVPSD
jgi:hypothetical protein